MIRDWYAEEVRQLNEDFANNNAGDMPVPASARSVMDTIRFAVAFARVHLREQVTDEDVERAMDLSKALIGQTFDGGSFQPEATKSADTMDDRMRAVYDAIEKNQPAGTGGADIDDVLTTTQNDANMDPATTEKLVENLKRKGEVYQPANGEVRTA
jgi:replicative DNA helicase Mcm